MLLGTTPSRGLPCVCVCVCVNWPGHRLKLQFSQEELAPSLVASGAESGGVENRCLQKFVHGDTSSSISASRPHHLQQSQRDATAQVENQLIQIKGLVMLRDWHHSMVQWTSKAPLLVQFVLVICHVISTTRPITSRVLIIPGLEPLYLMTMSCLPCLTELHNCQLDQLLSGSCICCQWGQANDLFIPAQGAPNGSQVPPQRLP